MSTTLLALRAYSLRPVAGPVNISREKRSETTPNSREKLASSGQTGPSFASALADVLRVGLRK